MTETPASTLETAIQAAEKTPEPSEAPEAVDEAPGSTETDKPSRRDRRAERRIGKLSKQLAQEREGNAGLRKRLDAVESQIEQKPERPARDSYENVEEYEDAYSDYREALRKPEGVEPEAVDERTSRFVSFAAEMSKVDTDFAKVLDTADFPCDGQMLDNLMEMDAEGAKVFTHLQANKAEATRLLALSDLEQSRELDKIADNLGVAVKKPDPVPEPIDPVAGNDEPPVNFDKMSDAQAVNHDLELLKRRRR